MSLYAAKVFEGLRKAALKAQGKAEAKRLHVTASEKAAEALICSRLKCLCAGLTIPKAQIVAIRRGVAEIGAITWQPDQLKRLRQLTAAVYAMNPVQMYVAQTTA